MSADGVQLRRMMTPAGAATKTKGISRENPRYNKQTTAKPNLKPNTLNLSFGKPLEKKASAASFTHRDHRGSSNIENMSVSSKASWIGGVARVGNNLLRSSRSFFVRSKKGFKSEAEEFFLKNANNLWRAEKSAVFKCDTDKDNAPTHIEWRGFNFCISQNRDGGRKPQGQDSIGVASHKNWEVFCLCDGHDRDGHLVSQGVCATLPNFILRRIFERKPELVNRPIEDALIIDAFKEVESTVCWSSTNPFEVGDYVKITSGKLKDEIGYIANFVGEDDDDDDDDDDSEEEEPEEQEPDIDDGTERVTVVVDNETTGYQRVILRESQILSPRYKGGSTCLCLIKNSQTDRCKVAVLGDSRLMLLGEIGKKFKSDDFIDPVLLTTYIDVDENEEAKDEAEGGNNKDVDVTELRRMSSEIISKESEIFDQIGYFTPQHNVFNANERHRLQAYQEKMNGEYVVNLEDGYLVNPETKMQIQPTRGFGDVEMQSAGYIHLPEISSNFILTPNTILVGASDGIFDGDLWGNDEDFLKYIYELKKSGSDAQRISSSIYDETTKRCQDKDRLDDISMFVFISPRSKKKYKRRQQPKSIRPKTRVAPPQTGANPTLSKSTRAMKSRRVTIQRVDRPGAHLFRKFFSKRTNLLD